MITPLGKYLKILRIEENELLLDMSTKLGISPSYLSSIEHGKREISEKIVNLILEQYPNVDENKLNELVDSSKMSVKINLTNMSQSDRALAVSFARKLDSLSDEDKNKISNLFKED